MITFPLVFGLVAMAAIHLFLLHIRDQFRQNIQPGMIAGIKFGDYVVNRVIQRTTKESVFVQDLRMERLTEVSKDRVYMPDPQTANDEKVEHE